MINHSSFNSFRPSELETKSEKTNLIVSVIRLAINTLMATLCVIINVCKVKKDWGRHFSVSEVVGALVEFMVLILFLVQFFSLLSATPTHELFEKRFELIDFYEYQNIQENCRNYD